MTTDTDRRVADKLIQGMLDSRTHGEIDRDAAENLASLNDDHVNGTDPSLPPFECASLNLAEYLAGYLSALGLDKSDACEISERMVAGYTSACDNPEAANGLGYEFGSDDPALLIRDDDDQGALVQHYENQPDSVPTGIDPF